MAALLRVAIFSGLVAAGAKEKADPVIISKMQIPMLCTSDILVTSALRSVSWAEPVLLILAMSIVGDVLTLVLLFFCVLALGICHAHETRFYNNVSLHTRP